MGRLGGPSSGVTLQGVSRKAGARWLWVGNQGGPKGIIKMVSSWGGLGRRIDKLILMGSSKGARILVRVV